MNPEAAWMLILRRPGIALAGLVVVLGVVAAILAVNVIGQARQLVAGAPASEAPTPSASAIEPSHHDRHAAPSATIEPTPSATPAATPIPTPAATPEPDAPWTLAASFGDGAWGSGVMDVDVWQGAFVAVGTTWGDSTPEPRMWRSADGRAWSEVALDLGSGVALEAMAPLADGRLMILGTMGGSVEYWSDPERAVAWTSADAVTWTPAIVPFGTAAQVGPLDFTAGAEGLLATTGDDIWHSADGSSWHHVYDAPQGTMLHSPVAGDEGWIVRRSNASFGTTTLLVSGDASTWHEVDLGNVATVANVGGDWLASRSTADWEGAEILRSANGLDWSVILDLDALMAADGLDPEGTAGIGGGAMLSGTDEVIVMSPWRAGHCGGMPSGGWGAWWSSEGAAWTPTGLGGDAVVNHTVAIGGVIVLAGYTAETGDVAFWVSAP